MLKRLAYILVPVLIITTLGLGSSVQAATRSANAPAAAACRAPKGTSSSLRETANGPTPVGGTIFVKHKTGCPNLAITFVGATDRYQGWLFNTRTGKWSHCHENHGHFIRITKGSHSHKPVLLCTNVAATTQMAVVQASSHHRKITLRD